MCGIAGKYSYKGGPGSVVPEELLRIRDSMTTRGPDGAGLWISPHAGIGLAHRRLSIIDRTEAGGQPMQDDLGELVVTFNGEIYNYPELRKELESRGVRFRSNCDTEVLIHLYRHCGTTMLNRLRGMFAFALWDTRKHHLLLARDPFGIKPLYLSDNGHEVRFASQVKALLVGGAIDPKPSAAGHVGFLMWGSVPEPHTLYANIRPLPAGHYALYGATGLAQERCFSRVRDLLAAGEDVSRRHDHNPPDLRDTLLDSVRHHLLADVPVGVFLSAGRDSTALAALATELQGKLCTFTLGFEEYRGTPADETPLAERVARQLGATHTTAWISSAQFDVERFLSAMDQPSVDGLNTYLVSKSAAQIGLKVALSGLGGDEIFGGYPSFRRIPMMERWLGKLPRIPHLTSTLDAITPPSKRKYAGVLEYGRSHATAYLLTRCLNVPWRLKELLDPAFLQEGWDSLQTDSALDNSIRGIRSNTRKVSSLELEWYTRNQLLRDADWASMAHSLEIRVPFLDIEVLNAAAARHRPWTKHDLATTPAAQMPSEVLKKRKTGFTVPIIDWTSQALGLPRTDKERPWARYLYQRFLQNSKAAAATPTTETGAIAGAPA